MNARMIGNVLHAGGFKFVSRQPRERRGGNGKTRAAKRLLDAQLKVAKRLEKETRISRRELYSGTKNSVLGPSGWRCWNSFTAWLISQRAA
jgi:hypothetical protein